MASKGRYPPANGGHYPPVAFALQGSTLKKWESRKREPPHFFIASTLTLFPKDSVMSAFINHFLTKQLKNMKSTIQTTPLLQVAEISISYSSIVKPSERLKIGSSRDACKILRDNWGEGSIEHREEMRIMLLNRMNKVLGVFLVSVGGFAGTVCDPKVVFQAALKANASSIILAHYAKYILM